MERRRSFFVLASLVTVAGYASAGEVLRVPSEFGSLQAAIDAAQPGDRVLVAAGVYRGTGNRDIDFQGKDLHVVSESGAAGCVIDCEGTYEAPHRGFVFQSGETRAAVLEGFTIMGSSTQQGAIADIFNGGGVFIRNASPTILDCTFTQNTAGCWGGAAYVSELSSPLFSHCMFVDNLADDDGGGLFLWNGATPTVSNSVFVGNHANTAGGAIAGFGGGDLTLVHSTVTGNTAGFGGGIYDFGLLTVRNSIVWGNGDSSLFFNGDDVAYSIIEGGYPGIGNLDVDPMVAPDGYHLLPGSPAIGAGNPGWTPGLVTHDIDGQPRMAGGGIDVGADELGGHRRGEGGQAPAAEHP